MLHCTLGRPWPGPRRIARKSWCHIVPWGVPGRDQAESPENLGVTLYFGVSLAGTKPNRQQIEVSQHGPRCSECDPKTAPKRPHLLTSPPCHLCHPCKLDHLVTLSPRPPCHLYHLVTRRGLTRLATRTTTTTTACASPLPLSLLPPLHAQSVRHRPVCCFYFAVDCKNYVL